MGFLESGTPLAWHESRDVIDYVKLHGLHQLLHIWSLNKDREDYALRWGEEVEYNMMEVTETTSRVYADATSMVEELGVREHMRTRVWTEAASDWHPEFANHMIEAIPSPPYLLNLDSIGEIEFSMWLRRVKIQMLLPTNRFVTSQTAFPRFGLDDFVALPENSGTTLRNPDLYCSVSRSVFVPDAIINPHPRFPTLVSNICSRRGAKPFILIPLYRDVRTDGGIVSVNTSYDNVNRCAERDWSLSRPVNELDRFSAEELSRKTLNPVKDRIYMDAFAFGMGMSCVQTTFTCHNISEARYLYDQLVVLAPLMLALTAATPVLRGLLADTDTRWRTLEQAVDCRTEEEQRRIPKSRYSAVSLYIADREPLVSSLQYLNDTDPPVNFEAMNLLMSHGMDEILSRHFGHLWIRDPMVVFAEKIELDDTKAVDHFENIQSTNWNSVRFKPPPPSATGTSPIGWRVEFRTPELQLTDFENAAGVALVSVLAQMILAWDLDLYIPMHMNDINMARSYNRNAVLEEKFFFRKTVESKGPNNARDPLVAEMSLKQILAGTDDTTSESGSEGRFPGLIPMCRAFVAEQHSRGLCTERTVQQFHVYSDLFLKRVSGELMTDAQYLREFIKSHPCYNFDSVVDSTICRDITVLSVNLGFGLWGAKQLLGPLHCNEHGALSHTLNWKNGFPSLPDNMTFPLFSQSLSCMVNQHTGIFTGFFLDKCSAVVAAGGKRPVLFESQDVFQSTQAESRTVTNDAGNEETSATDAVRSVVFSKRRDIIPGCAGVVKVAGDVVDSQLRPRRPETQFAHTSISSEDFTRCWILKGFDFIGRGETKQDCSGSQCESTWLPSRRHPEKCTNVFTVTKNVQPDARNSSAVTFHHCQPNGTEGSLKMTCAKTPDTFIIVDHAGSTTERISTVCPSSFGSGHHSAGEPVGDELLVDLKEDIPFVGFQSEQDAEYFQQVHDCSS